MRETAKEIVKRLQKAGHDAFWVGGSVRDYLLGREPGDYDIATSAKPDDVEKLFKRTIAVGKKFGVMVVLEKEHQFQVATFRAEADYKDGRRPETVVFANAEADALRRDFTVNGLFYDPVTEKLHDWVGGEADLKKRVIRTIGSPEERFGEDHLRMLRAVRFAAQLDFEIEEKTFAALKANAAKIKGISAERIREELVKLFSPKPSTSTNKLESTIGTPSSLPSGFPSPTIEMPQEESFAVAKCGLQGEGEAKHDSHESDKSKASSADAKNPSVKLPEGKTLNGIRAARGLELLKHSGLLEHVLPELAATVTCEQSPDYHPEGSVFEHLKLMLSKLPSDAPEALSWAVLMHDIAKPVTASKDEKTGSIHFYEHEKIGARMATEIMTRLRFPNKEIEEVSTAVLYHMQFKDAPQMRKSTLRRMLMRPTFPLELQLHRLDCLGSHGHLDVYEFLQEQEKELAKQPEIHPPLLTGAELIEMGMKPGPEMGKLLGEVREKQLQDELKTKAEAKKWVKSRLSS